MSSWLNLIEVLVTLLLSQCLNLPSLHPGTIQLLAVCLSHLLDFIADVGGHTELCFALCQQVVHRHELLLHHLESLLSLVAELSKGALHQRVDCAREAALILLAFQMPINDSLSLLLIFALLNFLPEQLNLLQQKGLIIAKLYTTGAN